MSEPSVTSAEPTERHRLPVRTLVAASIGNAIEWYDWTIYATFSIFFATQIFSAENETLALISTLATYAVAFFFRPLGGWLLGRFADLHGRRTAMLVTILLMAGGSFVIGILPTFSMVGWLAPILLLLARIAQGMSLGGEVSNASAYLAEIAPADRRGRYSSFFYISTGVGGAHRLAAGRAAHRGPHRGPAGRLRLAHPVPARRRARHRRAVAAAGHAGDRAVRAEQGQGQGAEATRCS